MKIACKTYIEDGVKYQFNSLLLKMFIDQKKESHQKSHQKITQAQIRDEIAEKACVSSEAVKNWMYGNNAPTDLELVKVLAEYFDVDYHLLLREEKEMTTATEIRYYLNSDAQKEYTRNLVRGLYQGMRRLLVEIRDYAWEFWNYDPKPEVLFSEEIKTDIHHAYEKMTEMRNNIMDQLKDGMLDLPQEFYYSIFHFLDHEIDTLIRNTANPSIMIYDTTDDSTDIAKDIEWAYSYFIEDDAEMLRELFDEYIVE